MKVIGIDQSSHFGWAIGDHSGAQPFSNVHDLSKLPLDAMLAFVFKHLGELRERHRFTHVFYEKPVLVPSNGLPIIEQQLSLCATIQLWARLNELDCYHAAPADWRKTFFNGRKPGKLINWKQFAMEECSRRGWRTKDHNQAEAIGVMYHGLCFLDFEWHRKQKDQRALL